jgi:hypothetical protein
MFITRLNCVVSPRPFSAIYLTQVVDRQPVLSLSKAIEGFHLASRAELLLTVKLMVFVCASFDAATSIRG